MEQELYFMPLGGGQRVGASCYYLRIGGVNLILDAGGDAVNGLYLTDNAQMECAYYPESRTLIVINNADTAQACSINTAYGVEQVQLEAFDTVIRQI